MCHTAEATLDVLRAVLEDRIISLRSAVVWPPRSCDLTPLDYYLWVVIKDKCYADKPETIDILKASILEAIGEIQLHTIDTYIIGHYNPSVRIFNLVSHTTYVVCVNFMHE